jgi:hypothetical protein
MIVVGATLDLLSGAPLYHTSVHVPLLHLCAPFGARAAQKGGTDETARVTGARCKGERTEVLKTTSKKI